LNIGSIASWSTSVYTVKSPNGESLKPSRTAFAMLPTPLWSGYKFSGRRFAFTSLLKNF
jgi:hypothetical protein